VGTKDLVFQMGDSNFANYCYLKVIVLPVDDPVTATPDHGLTCNDKLFPFSYGGQGTEY